MAPLDRPPAKNCTKVYYMIMLYEDNEIILYCLKFCIQWRVEWGLTIGIQTKYIKDSCIIYQIKAFKLFEVQIKD